MSRFVVEYRRVFNDVRVSPWERFYDIGWHTTPLEAYAELCAELGCIVLVDGFVDSPDWGRIRTVQGKIAEDGHEMYASGDYTLFRHPEDQDIQYRIIELLSPPAPVPEQSAEYDRVINLD